MRYLLRQATKAYCLLRTSWGAVDELVAPWQRWYTASSGSLRTSHRLKQTSLSPQPQACTLATLKHVGNCWAGPWRGKRVCWRSVRPPPRHIVTAVAKRSKQGNASACCRGAAILRSVRSAIRWSGAGATNPLGLPPERDQPEVQSQDQPTEHDAPDRRSAKRRPRHARGDREARRLCLSRRSASLLWRMSRGMGALALA